MRGEKNKGDGGTTPFSITGNSMFHYLQLSFFQTLVTRPFIFQSHFDAPVNDSFSFLEVTEVQNVFGAQSSKEVRESSIILHTNTWVWIHITTVKFQYQ